MDDDEFRAHVRMLVYEPFEPLVLCLARWLAKYLL